MDVWKYEFISRVEQDISLVRFAHSWDILPHIHVFFSIYSELLQDVTVSQMNGIPPDGRLIGDFPLIVNSDWPRRQLLRHIGTQ